MTREETLLAYSRLFEDLHPDNLETLDNLCSDTIHFTDPFNSTVGLDAYKDVLLDMFEQLERATFQVHDTALTDTAGYIRWTFTMQTRKNGPLQLIPGMTEVTINDDGQITRHLDHWDSGTCLSSMMS